MTFDIALQRRLPAPLQRLELRLRYHLPWRLQPIGQLPPTGKRWWSPQAKPETHYLVAVQELHELVVL